MKTKSKALLLALCAVLLAATSMLGTVAYLTDSESVANTFTVGKVAIELTESKPEDRQASIIPGVDIVKNPKVTVLKDSEACWLFVRVEETDWPAFTETDGTKKVAYALADGWMQGDDTEIPATVWYRSVDAVSVDTGFNILQNDQVTVSENLTKAEIESITAQPKLTITAYAVQREGIATAAEAWTNVNA